MLPTFENIHLLYLVIAIILEVIANVLMKISKGFERKLPALMALICVLAAFSALSLALGGIQLSVAYGLWGGFGLVATALFGMLMFRERLKVTGWLGMGFVVIGIFLIRVA